MQSDTTMDHKANSLFAILLFLSAPSCVPPAASAGPERPAPWEAGELDLGPYLRNLGDNRFAVVVGDSSWTLPPTVEWWPADDRAASQRLEARRRDDLWVAVLDGLAPGTRVSYRVVSGDRTTQPRSFTAGQPRGTSFRFAVFGDTRTNHVVHWQVIKALSRERVDFAIHTGDMVSYGVQDREWRRFLAIEHPLMTKVPLVPVMGNHDVSKLGYFRRYFVTDMASGGRRYFARDWGDVRLVLVDAMVEYREGSTQFRYLDRKLAEAARAGMYIVMATHEPPFSSGKHGSNLVMRKTLHQLARRHGVELVVSGHDHNYERTKPQNGVTYLVSGSAGAPIRPVRPRTFSAKTRLEPHYVLIDVEKRGMTLRAINLQGDTFDSEVIPPNPPLNPAEAAGN